MRHSSPRASFGSSGASRRSLRTVGALFVVAAALVAGACSDDDSGDDEESSETTTTVAETTTTLSDEDYAAELETFSTAYEEALANVEEDPCAVVSATQLGPQATPANETQMEQTIAVYVEVIRGFGALVPEDAEANEAFNNAADSIAAEAEAAGYPPDFLTSEEQPAALQDEAYLAAGERLSAKLQPICQPQTSEGAAPEGSTPEGGAGAEAPATTAAP